MWNGFLGIINPYKILNEFKQRKRFPIQVAAFLKPNINVYEQGQI